MKRYHARKIVDRRRKLGGDTARRYWERIAEQVGLGLRGFRQRVHEPIDAMVSSKVETADRIASRPRAAMDMLDYIADVLERSALRMAG